MQWLQKILTNIDKRYKDICEYCLLLCSIPYALKTTTYNRIPLSAVFV